MRNAERGKTKKKNQTSKRYLPKLSAIVIRSCLLRLWSCFILGGWRGADCSCKRGKWENHDDGVDDDAVCCWTKGKRAANGEKQARKYSQHTEAQREGLLLNFFIIILFYSRAQRNMRNETEHMLASLAGVR